MQRRHFLQTSALTGVSLLSAKNLLAQFLAEDPYKMKDLRGGVGVFTEKGGTIAYLITKEGIAVVDTQFPEQAEHLIGALKKTSEQPTPTPSIPITTAIIRAVILRSKAWPGTW